VRSTRVHSTDRINCRSEADRSLLIPIRQKSTSSDWRSNARSSTAFHRSWRRSCDTADRSVSQSVRSNLSYFRCSSQYLTWQSRYLNHCQIGVPQQFLNRKWIARCRFLPTPVLPLGKATLAFPKTRCAHLSSAQSVQPNPQFKPNHIMAFIWMLAFSSKACICETVNVGLFSLGGDIFFTAFNLGEWSTISLSRAQLYIALTAAIRLLMVLGALPDPISFFR